MRPTIWKCAIVMCVAAVGCSDDSEPHADAGQDAGAEAGTGGALTLATYNLGLLDSVGYVEERSAQTIESAARLDADLLCVQEVWEQKHWDALVAADSERPHVLRLPAEPGAMGRCDPDRFDTLRTCAEPACGNVGGSGLTACVLGACMPQVGTLSSGCIECLLENAPTGDFAAIRSACVGTGSEGTPAPEDRSYVSGGSYGIGLLSSLPFAETDEKRLDASTVRRAILYGRLDDTPIGTVHVFCTHLTAILTGLQYEGSYGDWAGENAAHVRALIEWVDEKAAGEGKVIVLGDLNTGPSGADISPSVPDNYAALPEAGFENAFLAGPNAACTFCTSNSLVASEDTGAGAAIDHILSRAIDQSITTERVLDEPITIQVAAGDAGAGAAERMTHLSDHFGLRATIRD